MANLPASLKNLTKEHVPLLIEKLDKNIEELKTDTVKKIENPIIKGLDINIYEEENPVVLIKALAALRISYKAYNQEVDGLLGNDYLPEKYHTEEYTNNGNTFEVWEEAISLQISKLANTKMLEDLKEARELLSQFETEEQKIQKVMRKIASMFS